MKAIAIAAAALACICAGCTSETGGPARTGAAGPYRFEYGVDGTNEFLVVRKGDQTVYTTKGNAITVYADGRAFLSYASSGPNNAISAYMVHIRNAEGQDAFTLLDENVDGTFDRKIDYGTKQVYAWTNGQWALPPKK